MNGKLLHSTLGMFVHHTESSFPGGRACTLRLRRGNELRLIAAHGLPVDGRESDIAIEDTIAGKAVLTAKPVLRTIADEPLYLNKALAQEQGWVTMLAVPLLVNGETYGVIQVYSSEDLQTLTPAHVAVIEQYAVLAGGVFGLLTIQEEHLRQREAFLEIVEGIAAADTLSAGLQLLVERLAHYLGQPACSLYLLDQRILVLAAGHPREEGRHGVGKRFLLSDLPFAAETVATGRPVILEDALTDPRTTYITPHLRRWGVVSIGCFPVLDGHNGDQTVTALLIVDHTRDPLFREQERSFIEFMTRYVAGPIRSMRELDVHRRRAALQVPATPPTARVLTFTVVD